MKKNKTIKSRRIAEYVKKNTKRNEGKDEFFAAVDAAVTIRVVQRICHGTTIAQRQKILCILVGLSSDIK